MVYHRYVPTIWGYTRYPLLVVYELHHFIPLTFQVVADWRHILFRSVVSPLCWWFGLAENAPFFLFKIRGELGEMFFLVHFSPRMLRFGVGVGANNVPRHLHSGDAKDLPFASPSPKGALGGLSLVFLHNRCRCRGRRFRDKIKQAGVPSFHLAGCPIINSHPNLWYWL